MEAHPDPVEVVTEELHHPHPNPNPNPNPTPLPVMAGTDSPMHGRFFPDDGQLEEFDPSTMCCPEFARELLRRLVHHSGDEDFRVLSPSALREILYLAKTALAQEENIAHVRCPRGGRVVVVGDLHGQLHDLATLVALAGHPDPSGGVHFVFNGDYVDRGSWGVEVLLLLLVWRLVWPRHVVLLRGNHETSFCTQTYGFAAEAKAKYSTPTYRAFLGLFKVLPLAAVVHPGTLVLHGGLFRNPRDPRKAGNLEDLSRARRTDEDPQDNLVEDLLWSDPSPEPGLRKNETRGCGYFFGPDVTNRFMEDNNLRLIIRSHEGPDAREKRPEMGPVTRGYSVDQQVHAGMLVTLFSAPNYPQFQPAGMTRVENQAAYAVLHAGAITTPEFHSYTAVPRPQVQAYYDYEVAVDSDSELSR